LRIALTHRGMVDLTEGTTMTIQEAIKSGKMFKRPKWTVYFRMAFDGWLVRSNANDVTSLTKKDILATDWETKP
jgi:hypothetical protein